ncbi:hypothetical protein TGME49_281955 [Toxoplasma gondii ME49]|uniref:Uncharacterized protein n=3 Tax=Toxoplasma gondii TaxID=5811 RepID=A0A2G8XYV0_TOXGO|nr:hypothetical protein TGME49_281955 [Toxoplasma gondii ME49]EPT30359.1 hypothetical protein TGME49_281955 [Toxoplasma gondii ME49]KYF43974.1 hypothetical protein TGARI_281955 [Toxoplasma gondii ARI]PIL99908.1 hypothetical protein TGCOUG_281955 [Toxoplasma gondii COUG]|eukprot:XP_018637462.1 hypothetical protein TGME49_281955 [Toxoplasma gondii ME49]
MKLFSRGQCRQRILSRGETFTARSDEKKLSSGSALPALHYTHVEEKRADRLQQMVAGNLLQRRQAVRTPQREGKHALKGGGRVRPLKVGFEASQVGVNEGKGEQRRQRERAEEE